eukprot:TRINITY_DN111358_c0_g1_i1.p1 TRINITY_DN111358_c0_g1~~TRINITY_DN111358_c0_g1_i1.p1  ORF type:complete len:605 (-),score=110.49 TRINITY_DN111358_c0_g1_i1:527-2341(-)
MITYDNHACMWSLLLSHRGSVVPVSFACSLPSAITAALLILYYQGEPSENFGGDTVRASQLWSAMTAVITFLIGFRTNKAYGRFWDGTTLLHQMWGEWFDAASCLFAFSSLAMKKRPIEVNCFRHTLIRLMSLMHSSALEEIALAPDSEDADYPRLDIGALDQVTLRYLRDCKSNKELNFNRVEVVIHMIQTLIVKAHDEGVIQIPPPILSRVFQTLSRGQVNLANCKKITHTLFPFPYAQLIACLMVAYCIMTPVVMSSVCEKPHWAFIFSIVPIFGLFALNLVARELEMPFGLDANDLPLLEFQEHMNTSMLMLACDETDHVPYVTTSCQFEFDGIKKYTSTARCRDFILETPVEPVKPQTGIPKDDNIEKRITAAAIQFAVSSSSGIGMSPSEKKVGAMPPLNKLADPDAAASLLEVELKKNTEVLKANFTEFSAKASQLSQQLGQSADVMAKLYSSVRQQAFGSRERCRCGGRDCSFDAMDTCEAYATLQPRAPNTSDDIYTPLAPTAMKKAGGFGNNHVLVHAPTHAMPNGSPPNGGAIPTNNNAGLPLAEVQTQAPKLGAVDRRPAQGPNGQGDIGPPGEATAEIPPETSSAIHASQL